MASSITSSPRRPGPIVQMNCSSPEEFWGVEGDREQWVAFGDYRIQLYDEAVALKDDPEGRGVFVEVLNQSPDFPHFPDLGRNEELLVKDHERWAPHADELVWDAMRGTATRLVGIHIDRNDFYYRLRGEGGGDMFLSMAVALPLLREEWSQDDYAEMEETLTASGAGPLGSLLVTREMEMFRPIPFGKKAFVLLFTKEDHLIFGPFEDEGTFDAFRTKFQGIGEGGFQTDWDDRVRSNPRFRGLELPEGIEDRPTDKISDEDFLNLFFLEFVP